MTACWADMAARDYADREGREAEFDDAIDSRARELMAPGKEYDPLNARNFDEAIGETLAAQNSTFAAKMADLLREGKDAEFVKLVRNTAKSYMLRLAMIEAETQLDQEGEQDAADYHLDCLKDAEIDFAFFGGSVQ